MDHKNQITGQGSRIEPAKLSGRFIFLLVCGLLLTGLCGCASTRHGLPAGFRKFDFQKDTFSFPNQLMWEYGFDANGKWTNQKHQPKPDYALHCFVIARAARQFFQNARFDSNQPVADEATYRKLVQRVVAIDPSHRTLERELVVIPGYANLHAFSLTHESLLKAECGGAWRSYFQRGNWRMVFPFLRSSQEKSARRLLADLKTRHPPIAHLVRFPQETINHAILVYDAVESAKEIRFIAYDPNHTDTPATLIYDRASRTFNLPANNYFPGGRVDVYEIYRSWIL